MMKDALNKIILMWLASYVLSDGGEALKVPFADPENDSLISEDESNEIFKKIVLIGQIGSLVAVPLFGYLTDKLSAGYELIVAFGARCATCFLFFFLDSPKGFEPITILVAMTLFANLQEVVIESLFAKRLPGDVRASMKSV